MDRIFIHPGDYFFKGGHSLKDEVVKAVETIRGLELAVYSHAGTLTDPHGGTVEALSTIRAGSINAYSGDPVLIMRWNKMNAERFNRAMTAIKSDMGKCYPWLRLLAFLIPEGPEIFSMGGSVGVCSEIAAEGDKAAGDPLVGHWQGWTPQSLADMMLGHKDFSVVFRGAWNPARLR